MNVLPWVEASVYAPGSYENWLEGAKRWEMLGMQGILLVTSPFERTLFKRAQYDVRHLTVVPGLKTNPVLSGKPPLAGWLEFGQAARDIARRTGSNVIVLDNETLFGPAYSGSTSFNWLDHQTGLTRMAGLVPDLEFWVYPGVRGLGSERETSIRLVRLFTDAPLNCRVLDTVSFWGPGADRDPETAVSRNKLEAVCPRPPIPMIYCFSRTSAGGAVSWPAWSPPLAPVGCAEAEKRCGQPVLMFCGNADWPTVAKTWLD